MNRFLSILLSFQVLASILTGCRNPERGEAIAEQLSFDDHAEAWVDSTMRSMTDREMAGQLILPAIYSRLNEADKASLRFYADSLQVGGLLLLQGDVESAAGVADMMRTLSPIGPWIAIDAEWGLGMRLTDAPEFPRNSRISADTDRQLLFDYGEEVARECRVLGINMVLGPVADISEKGSMMESRSFGDDPQLVADMMIAYSQGLETGGMVSVAKHFPGHGRNIGDSHKLTPEINLSRDSLERTDLYPFRRYADARLSGVMAGHIVVRSLDASGKPASVSGEMLSGILREDMGFEGLILTDALNMDGVNGWTAADAILAGADMVIAPADTRNAIEEIAFQMKNDSLFKKRVMESCRRVLEYKFMKRVAGPEMRKRAVNHQRSLKDVLHFGSDSLKNRMRHSN